MNQVELRQRMVILGKRLYDRGLSPGTSGNMSIRINESSFLMTPTNSCMGELNPSAITLMDFDGHIISGNKPSKEYFFHLEYFKHRPEAQAIVHLHSTYSSAVSCLKNVDTGNILPPITPYYVMKIGQLPLIPYRRPGDPRLGDDVAKLAPKYKSLMLANHGPIVTGPDIDSAVAAAEELEETARLFLLLRGCDYRILNTDQIGELCAHSGSVWNS